MQVTDSVVSTVWCADMLMDSKAFKDRAAKL